METYRKIEFVVMVGLLAIPTIVYVIVEILLEEYKNGKDKNSTV